MNFIISFPEQQRMDKCMSVSIYMYIYIETERQNSSGEYREQ
jgi:hypothetical protein